MSKLRVLLSEGSSTSAREAITALALSGHAVAFCDPSPFCLGRFSTLVHRRFRCPALGRDPMGYRAFIRQLVQSHEFDVLLPIHEQGLLFARVAAELTPHIGLALPSYESYVKVYNKVAFGQLLAELGLPQPRTVLVTDTEQIGADPKLPLVVKMAIGTASRGTWLARDRGALEEARAAASKALRPGDLLLVQEFVEGPLEQVQGVFREGTLLACHGWRRVIEGAGGGAALKVSIRRRSVENDLARLGETLRWHGALSLEYIAEGVAPLPRYIDANPRLVEPMAARIAGLDLADLLVRLSAGSTPPAVAESREGVRSRLAVQALLGSALQSRSRRAVLRTGLALLLGSDRFSDAAEELTPVRDDPASGLAVLATAAALLAWPAVAGRAAQKGWGQHLVTREAANAIASM